MYLQGKHAIIQEGINLVSCMLDNCNAVNKFCADHDTTTDHDDYIVDFIDTTSDIDTDKDN